MSSKPMGSYVPSCIYLQSLQRGLRWRSMGMNIYSCHFWLGVACLIPACLGVHGFALGLIDADCSSGGSYARSLASFQRYSVPCLLKNPSWLFSVSRAGLMSPIVSGWLHSLWLLWLSRDIQVLCSLVLHAKFCGEAF